MGERVTSPREGGRGGLFEVPFFFFVSTVLLLSPRVRAWSRFVLTLTNFAAERVYYGVEAELERTLTDHPARVLCRAFCWRGVRLGETYTHTGH